jgi:hypothetical protein
MHHVEIEEKDRMIRTKRYDERTVNESAVNVEDASKETNPSSKRRKLWEKPPGIEIAFGDPIPDDNLEILKGLIKKARLRRQKRLLEAKAPAQNQAPHLRLRFTNLSDISYTKPLNGRNFSKMEHSSREVKLLEKKA